MGVASALFASGRRRAGEVYEDDTVTSIFYGISIDVS